MTITYRLILPLVLIGSGLSLHSLAAQSLAVPYDPSIPSGQTLITEPTEEAPGSENEPKAQKNKIPFFTIAGQRLVSYLSNLKSSIERAQGIADTEKKTILAALNKDISYVQTEVITVGKERTEEDVNRRIQRVKQFWQGKQNTITHYLGLITGGKYRRTIERFTIVETKIETLFTRFKPSEEMLKLKETFSSELDAAESSYQEARDAFATMQSPGDHTEELKKGIAAFKEAHKHLAKARSTSRELISRIREIIGEPVPPTTSTPTLQP